MAFVEASPWNRGWLPHACKGRMHAHLDGGGRAAGYAPGSVVWLRDIRNSAARVAWKNGADKAYHMMACTQRYTQ
jgi:hypothetical protein